MGWYAEEFGASHEGRAGVPPADGSEPGPVYPVDWDQVDLDGEEDPAGPRDDWAEHIEEVESRTVPLPVELEDLLERLSKGMAALTRDSPLAELERTVERLGRRAAFTAQADDLSRATIGTALGVSEKEARARLARYGRDY